MLENTTTSSSLTPLSSSCHLMCSILPYFPLPSNLITGEYCACDDGGIRTQDLNRVTLLYKIGAIMAILMASALGVSLPIIGKNIPALRPESALFYLVKAFAAGVILSTGFIHILPDAFEDLTDPTLKGGPWGNFPFTGLAAMVGSLGTLMIDAFATGYYRKLHFGNGGEHHRHGGSGGVDEEMSGDHAGHVHLHTHATHGHAHLPFGSGSGSTPLGLGNLDQIRYRITSQVLEMGIVVHSVIIGISLGTSSNLDTIKPLIAALCFHQFFEGIGLGGCIAQAAFESGSTMCMALFFSLTTPLGVAVGIGITNIYDDSSPTALITQGMLNACAAGILIYMALVDLLAHDFMSYKLQANTRLFLGTNLSLLLGAGLMALLAIWA